MVTNFPDITPQPLIFGVGDGVYAFMYDPEANGEASAVVDLGVAVGNPQERTFGYPLSVDSSRIRLGFAADGTVVARQLQEKSGFLLGAAGLDAVEPEPGQRLPAMLARMAACIAGACTPSSDGNTVTYAAMGHADMPRVTAIVTREGARSGVVYH